MYTKLYQAFWRMRAGNLGRQLFKLDAELAAHERLSGEELCALQLDRLQTLVARAYDHVPFCRRRFDTAGIRPTDIRSLDDLQYLPVLTKADLHAHTDDGEMIAAGERKETLRRNATGGSTGAPVVFFQNGGQTLYGMANRMRYRRWYGHELGDKVALLWRSPRDLRANWRRRLRRGLRRERWLKKFRVHQKSILEIDVTYESEAPTLPEFEARLRQQILDNVGQEVNLSIKRVETIPPLPSGKLGYLVSDVPVGFIHSQEV